MTTPLTPAEIFRTEMFARLDAQGETIDAMREDLIHQEELIIKLTNGLTALLDGLQSATTAATATAASQPAQVGKTSTFFASEIVYGVDENGKQFFKLRGGPWSKSGIRIWPEVFPIIGLTAPAEYGRTPINPPVNVLVEWHDYTDPKTKETRATPYKLIGKA